MVRPEFLQQIYIESYEGIKSSTAALSHSASLWQPPHGGNCINWLLGHLIVSRCNFLMLLDVPSIWSLDRCLRFMPGSPPVTRPADAEPLAILLTDFDRTQEQLLHALARADVEDLSVFKGDRTVAENLLYYQAHEASHAGQIELLSQLTVL